MSARLREALELVLLVHRGGPWATEERQRWLAVTGSQEASTRSLCDHIRKVLAEEGRLHCSVCQGTGRVEPTVAAMLIDALMRGGLVGPMPPAPPDPEKPDEG
jgi:hypothetical protein